MSDSLKEEKLKGGSFSKGDLENLLQTAEKIHGQAELLLQKNHDLPFCLHLYETCLRMFMKCVDEYSILLVDAPIDDTLSLPSPALQEDKKELLLSPDEEPKALDPGQVDIARNNVDYSLRIVFLQEMIDGVVVKIENLRELLKNNQVNIMGLAPEKAPTQTGSSSIASAASNVIHDMETLPVCAEIIFSKPQVQCFRVFEGQRTQLCASALVQIIVCHQQAATDSHSSHASAADLSESSEKKGSAPETVSEKETTHCYLLLFKEPASETEYVVPLVADLPLLLCSPVCLMLAVSEIEYYGFVFTQGEADAKAFADQLSSLCCVGQLHDHSKELGSMEIEVPEIQGLDTNKKMETEADWLAQSMNGYVGSVRYAGNVTARSVSSLSSGISGYMNSGTGWVQTQVAPADQDVAVPSSVRVTLQSLNKVAGVALGVSGAVIKGISSGAVMLGTSVANRFVSKETEDKGDQDQPPPSAWRQRMGAAGALGKESVFAIGEVWSSLAQARVDLVDTAVENTSTLVGHRYGEEMEAASRDLLETGVKCVRTTYFARRLRRNAVAYSMAKGMGKGAADVKWKSKDTQSENSAVNHQGYALNIKDEGKGMTIEMVKMEPSTTQHDDFLSENPSLAEHEEEESEKKEKDVEEEGETKPNSIGEMSDAQLEALARSTELLQKEMDLTHPSSS